MKDIKFCVWLIIVLTIGMFVITNIELSHANELIYITTEDNENNDGIGNPDDDMGINLQDCIDKRSSIHPIEFNINVTGQLPVSNAYLSVFIEDVDWEDGERDEVFLNGHSLGFAVGENDLDNSTLFVIPDLSWVKRGNNLVQIHVDQEHVYTWWCASVQSGQLIFDDNSGIDTTTIRTLTSDSSEYDYGETVTINLEADTTLETQDLRLELLLRDPTGEIIAFDESWNARKWTIKAGNDEALSVAISSSLIWK